MNTRACFFGLLVASLLPAQTPIRYDAGTISGLTSRNIGSAEMSGRIAAVTAVNDGGRLTVFAASASGGVWTRKASLKSRTGGSRWPWLPRSRGWSTP